MVNSALCTNHCHQAGSRVKYQAAIAEASFWAANLVCLDLKFEFLGEAKCLWTGVSMSSLL